MELEDFAQVKFICHNDVSLPKKGSELSGAVDLQARGIMQWYKKDNTKVGDEFLDEMDQSFKNGKPLLLLEGQRILIDTDLQLADCPNDFRGNIRPRSGLALKHGITVLNSPGLIDADYRNQIGVILVNTSSEAFKIEFNDRIAQLEMTVGPDFPIVSTDVITEPDSSRNGGFGSTGVKNED